MRLLVLAALTILAIGPASAKGADELCGQLKAFERAVFQMPERKAAWINVYWHVDGEAIMSIACSHQQTEATRTFCSWVPGNVSMEFAGLLPQRILKCYSIRPNPFGVGKFPRRDLTFRTKLRNTIILQTGDLPAADGKPWMRIAIIPKSSKDSANVLPDPQPILDEDS